MRKDTEVGGLVGLLCCVMDSMGERRVGRDHDGSIMIQVHYKHAKG